MRSKAHTKIITRQYQEMFLPILVSKTLCSLDKKGCVKRSNKRLIHAEGQSLCWAQGLLLAVLTLSGCSGLFWSLPILQESRVSPNKLLLWEMFPNKAFLDLKKLGN